MSLGPPLVLATAVTDQCEAALVSGLEGEVGLRVARRCADVADVLACVSAGLAQVVVVSADLRGLDAAALELLEHHGCGVVVLVDSAAVGASGLEARLRQSGVGQVLPASAAPAEVAAAARAAAQGAGRGADGERRPASLADPRASLRPDPAPQPDVTARPASSPPSSPPSAPRGGSPGRVVTVWGPVGSPGRTTLAVELAAELAGAAQDVLLVDADTYGATVAQRLGLLDEAAGVAAACRALDRGALDEQQLVALAPVVLPRLRVLTGLARADRWPEVRGTALAAVLERARHLVDWVVVDTGFCLEQDEELAYDTVAPRRNQATLASLGAADAVVVVGAADPVGLQRLVRGLRELSEVPDVDAPRVVVANRVRAGAVGSRPGRQVREALARYAGVDDVLLVPDDPQAVDAAVLAGRTLAEHARASPMRAAVHDVVVRLRGLTAQRAEHPATESASVVGAGAH